jgi:tetratricopeptide (TPR) repeat protein
MLTVSTLLVIVVLQVAPDRQLPGGSAGAVREAVAEATEALERKDNVKALAAADRAVSVAPATAEGHLIRCRALAGLRRHEEAIAACGESLRLNPGNPDALRDRGHYYLNLGKVDPALADLREAESKTKIDRGVYYHLGMAYYLKGDFAAAAAAYEGCLRTSSEEGARVECQAWLYPSLRREGRDTDARNLLQSLHTSSLPGHPGNYLDRLLLFAGVRTEQDVSSTMAAEGALSETTVGYSIGLWHLLEGRPGRAREYFERVLETGYSTSWGYRAAESEMNRLR